MVTYVAVAFYFVTLMHLMDFSLGLYFMEGQQTVERHTMPLNA